MDQTPTRSRPGNASRLSPRESELPDFAGMVLFGMTTLIALIWLLILLGVGGFCGRPRSLSVGYLLLRAWVLGSVVAGVTFLALSQLGQFDTLPIMMATSILTLLSVLG